MKRIVLIFICCVTFGTYASGKSFGNTSIKRDSVELIDYYRNGNKKLEGFYYPTIDARGNTLYVAVGKQIKYYESGRIQAYQYFKDGVLHGKYESYTEQGVVDKTFFYVDGKLNGPYIFRYPDGQIMRIGTFKNDLDFGHSVRYHPNGKIALEEDYNEQGIQEGEVKIYNKLGELEKQEIMYNGKKKKS